MFPKRLGNRAPPAIETDGFGCPGVFDGVSEGGADQSDGCAGKAEVLEKVTPAELAVGL